LDQSYIAIVVRRVGTQGGSTVLVGGVGCKDEHWGRIEKNCKYLSNKMDTEANSVQCQITVRAERGDGTNIASGRHMLTTSC
jgi:hypothetical protein